MPVSDYTPGLDDVGAIDIARTRNANGAETGTFSPDTRPTDTQVTKLIGQALDDIRPALGEDIPADLFDWAKRLAALRTVLYIELTYFANEVAQNRSPYTQLKAMYDEELPNLINAIEEEESGADPKDPTQGKMAQFGFPVSTNWMYGRM